MASFGVKYGMRQTVLLLALLCAGGVVSAQNKETKIQQAAIRAAKAALISGFDSSLPRISLEYFLAYEAAGAPVAWDTTPCPLTPRREAGNAHTCVLATIELNDGRLAMVSVAVPAPGIAAGSVELRSVLITEEWGAAVRKISLIELPAAIHRKWPKTPQLDVWPSTLA
jgi:hypothetical protein